MHPQEPYTSRGLLLGLEGAFPSRSCEATGAWRGVVPCWASHRWSMGGAGPAGISVPEPLTCQGILPPWYPHPHFPSFEGMEGISKFLVHTVLAQVARPWPMDPTPSPALNLVRQGGRDRRSIQMPFLNNPQRRGFSHSSAVARAARNRTPKGHGLPPSLTSCKVQTGSCSLGWGPSEGVGYWGDSCEKQDPRQPAPAHLPAPQGPALP